MKKMGKNCAHARKHMSQEGLPTIKEADTT
jgi:hypothetical protein